MMVPLEVWTEDIIRLIIIIISNITVKIIIC